MTTSTATPAGTADVPYVPTPRPTSPAPPDQAASTEVLIIEQEVLLSTAAAVPARRESVLHRFVASVGRIWAVSAPESRPQRRDYLRRYEFLERSRMGREMDRL
jgi:hypothetical protein